MINEDSIIDPLIYECCSVSCVIYEFVTKADNIHFYIYQVSLWCRGEGWVPGRVLFGELRPICDVHVGHSSEPTSEL